MKEKREKKRGRKFRSGKDEWIEESI